MPDIFDQHAKSYADDIDVVLGQYGANHDFFTSHKAYLIRHLAKAQGLTLSEADLLDVGCGVGRVHDLIKNDVRSISGVDVSAVSIDVAREQCPGIDYRVYDGSQLPFEDDTFDISTAICVFHHIPPADWQTVAKEMLRVTKPSGFCLIIEHNPFNPVTWRIVSTCPVDADAVLLRQSKLKEIFRAAGAKSVRSRTVVSVPPANDFLKKVDHMLGILPFGAQYYIVANKQ